MKPPLLRFLLSTLLFSFSVHCGSEEGLEAGHYYASELIDFSPGPGAGFGQDLLPNIVLGPPDGTGPRAGGLDVLSLGQGGSITLGFGEFQIDDETGPDFIVFENAFWVGGDSAQVFKELGRIEVSQDGDTWIAFPCDPTTHEGCAGLRPPLPYDADATIPLVPEICGGDAFDLADVGLESARFVRIVDLSSEATAPSAGFDLDAVGIIHLNVSN